MVKKVSYLRVLHKLSCSIQSFDFNLILLPGWYDIQLLCWESVCAFFWKQKNYIFLKLKKFVRPTSILISRNFKESEKFWYKKLQVLMNWKLILSFKAKLLHTEPKSRTSFGNHAQKYEWIFAIIRTSRCW